MPAKFIFNDIALICVTYKSRNLANYFSQTARLFQNVWVIDNASNDGTIAEFQRHIPHAKILAMPKNIGFGPANNQGFYASQDTCSKVLFLNPDCTIDEESIHKLANALDQNPEAAIASPVVFSTTTYGANLKLRDLTKRYLASKASILEYSTNLPYIISDACLDGACFLAQSQKFQKIGAFDNNLFMYSEEDDISMRLHQKGHRKITVRDAHATHIGGASSDTNFRIELRKNTTKSGQYTI